MLLKSFLNYFCSVAGHCVLLKETTAIGEKCYHEEVIVVCNDVSDRWHMSKHNPDECQDSRFFSIKLSRALPHHCLLTFFPKFILVLLFPQVSDSHAPSHPHDVETSEVIYQTSQSSSIGRWSRSFEHCRHLWEWVGVNMGSLTGLHLHILVRYKIVWQNSIDTKCNLQKIL